MTQLDSKRERPIIFSGPMVRAILAGTKTQTRRVVKHYGISNVCRVSGPYSKLGDFDFVFPHEDDPTQDGNGHIVNCPYGAAGDRLWVRETWRRARVDGQEVIAYRADGDTQPLQCLNELRRWRPAIHMFRKDSRITLEVTCVRVERLQEINDADAIAEGVVQWDCPGERNLFAVNAAGDYNGPTARLVYQGLWDRINGVDSWPSNPWVWVIEFKRLP